MSSNKILNLPNLLTFSRIAIIPIFIIVYYLQLKFSNNNEFSWINFSLVMIFAIVSITDYLDGYFARKMNLVSKLGEFLDPIADKLMVVTALIILVDFYHNLFITICSIIIIMREIMVSALREWMSKIGRDNIKVIFIAKIKTFVQIFAILLLLYQKEFILLNFNIGYMLLLIATLLTIYSGFIYFKDVLKTF